jgi:hypothetical protein
MIPVAGAEDDLFERASFQASAPTIEDVDRIETEANRQSGSNPTNAIGLYGEARQKLDAYYKSKNMPYDLNYWNRVKQLEGRKADLSWRVGDEGGKNSAETAVRQAEGEINKLEKAEEKSSGAGSLISDIGEKLGQSGNTATMDYLDAWDAGDNENDPVKKDQYYQLAQQRLAEKYRDESSRDNDYYTSQRDLLNKRREVQQSLLQSDDETVRANAQSNLDQIDQDLQEVQGHISSGGRGSWLALDPVIGVIALSFIGILVILRRRR